MSAEPTPRIPESEWVWCGYPGHFVGGSACRFHMNTRIGDFRITSVGDYHPGGRQEPEQIGLDRLFETYVFRVEGHGDHGDGTIVDHGEIDSAHGNDPIAACAMHMAMCEKWAVEAAKARVAS